MNREWDPLIDGYQPGFKYKEPEISSADRALPQKMYGVVLGLPETLREEVAAVRTQYSPAAARRIFPHITLRAPFIAEESRAVSSLLEPVAAAHLPVRVTAAGIGWFEGPRHNVVYVKVERSEPLLQLHEAVTDAITDVEDVFPESAVYKRDKWVPHITIADNLDNDALERLLRELRDYNPRAEWEAKELLLVRSETSPEGSLLWATTRAIRNQST